MADPNDDGGKDLDDIATLIRSYALGALAVPDSAFQPVRTWTDLPLKAAMEGRRFAKKVFRPDANPYEDIGAEIAFAHSGFFDVVRFVYETSVVRLRIVEGASFYLLESELGWVSYLPAVVRLDEPHIFGVPDKDNWRSTKADLCLERATDWRDRIDALDAGAFTCVLIFKVESRSSVYEPRLRWF
jgi:hypothetical protein